MCNILAKSINIYIHNFIKMTNIVLLKISCLKKSLFSFIIKHYLYNTFLFCQFDNYFNWWFSFLPLFLSLHAFSINARRNRRFPLPVERSTNCPLASPLTNPETFPKDFYHSWWPVSFSSSSSFPPSLETCPLSCVTIWIDTVSTDPLVKNIHIVRNAQWFANNCVKITKKPDCWGIRNWLKSKRSARFVQNKILIRRKMDI